MRFKVASMVSSDGIIFPDRSFLKPDNQFALNWGAVKITNILLDSDNAPMVVAARSNNINFIFILKTV